MNESIDLTDCEREPITTPGAIQPHGVLLVLRGTGLTIIQAILAVGVIIIHHQYPHV